MPNSSGAPFGGIPRRGCWPEADVSVTLASAIHVVIEVTISLFTERLERMSILKHPRPAAHVGRFRICRWHIQRGSTLGEDIGPRDSIFEDANHQTGPFMLTRRDWPGNQGGSNGTMRLIGRSEKRKNEPLAPLRG